MIGDINGDKKDDIVAFGYYGVTISFDTVPLVDVHWGIASAAARAQTFDFCVSEIRPIVAVE